MVVEGVRAFDQPERYSQWKLGQKKSFFISFASRDESLILGRSDILSIRLPDDPDAPMTPPIHLVAQRDDTSFLVTMTIVSTLVIFILIVAYSICWTFKKDKIISHKEESETHRKFVPSMHPDSSGPANQMDSNMMNDTGKCDEMACSPGGAGKKDEADIQQMIEIASEIHRMMREEDGKSSSNTATNSAYTKHASIPSTNPSKQNMYDACDIPFGYSALKRMEAKAKEEEW